MDIINPNMTFLVSNLWYLMIMFSNSHKNFSAELFLQSSLENRQKVFYDNWVSDWEIQSLKTSGQYKIQNSEIKLSHHLLEVCWNCTWFRLNLSCACICEEIKYQYLVSSICSNVKLFLKNAQSHTICTS